MVGHCACYGLHGTLIVMQKAASPVEVGHLTLVVFCIIETKLPDRPPSLHEFVIAF